MRITDALRFEKFDIGLFSRLLKRYQNISAKTPLRVLSVLTSQYSIGYYKTGTVPLNNNGEQELNPNLTLWVLEHRQSAKLTVCPNFIDPIFNGDFSSR